MPVELVEEYAQQEAFSRPITCRRCAVTEFEDPSQATPVAETGPTITATFRDGPLKGRHHRG